MSVTEITPKIYNCNGSTTSFASGFTDIESFGVDDLTAANLTVMHWDDSAETETELTITTEYTISGTNIVTVATYPADDKIAILPEYDFLQSYNFTASPYLDTGSVQIAMDKDALNAQKNKNVVSRSLTTQITDDIVSLVIPRVEDRAGMFLGFDSSGVPRVSVGTTVESAEMSFGSDGFFFPDFICIKASNDQIKCVVTWHETPTAGTALAITLPSTSLSFRDAAGALATISGSHTVTGVAIDGKHVEFNINETGVFSSLASNIPVFPIASGTGMMLTIS